MTQGMAETYDERLERMINIERLMLMARHQPLAAAAHAVNSIVLIFVAFDDLGAGLSAAILTGFLGGATWQMWGWYRHRDAPKPTRVSPRTIRRATIWAWGFGSIWGAFLVLLLLRADTSIQMLACFIAAGMAAGGMLMLYSIPAAAYGFMATCILPPWIILATTGSEILQSLVIFSVVYVGFLILSAQNGYRNFVSGVQLRLQNEDLAKEAEAANQAKSSFLATMSHEIRTPMNGVLGLTELLADTDLETDQKQIVTTIQQSASILLRIINDILDFSKLNAGEMNVSAEPFSPAEVVENTLGMISATVRHKPVNIVAEGLESLPERVLGDPERFRQILNNLAGNAVKFTSEGFVKIKTAYSEGTGTSGILSVAVQDTGPGISADNIKTLFQPFTQFHSHTSGREAGTGLGLAISRRLAELMGGTLSIESELGAGSTFTLDVPLSRVTVEASHDAPVLNPAHQVEIETSMRDVLMASASQNADQMTDAVHRLSKVCRETGNVALMQSAERLKTIIDDQNWGDVSDSLKEFRRALGACSLAV